MCEKFTLFTRQKRWISTGNRVHTTLPPWQPTYLLYAKTLYHLLNHGGNMVNYSQNGHFRLFTPSPKSVFGASHIFGSTQWKEFRAECSRIWSESIGNNHNSNAKKHECDHCYYHYHYYYIISNYCRNNTQKTKPLQSSEKNVLKLRFWMVTLHGKEQSPIARFLKLSKVNFGVFYTYILILVQFIINAYTNIHHKYI